VVKIFSAVSPFLKRRALRGYEDHIYHGTNFYLPPFYGKCVATFHDLSVYSWACCHPPERVRYMRKELILAVKRADLLLTDSEYVRHEVASFFGLSLEKVRAVPLASSGEFYPRNLSEIKKGLSELGLVPEGYCLFSGTIEPRKNIDTLIDAYAQLPARDRIRWPLVLTGYRGWKSGTLHDRIEAASRQGWVRYLGYVPMRDLPLLFSGARLFVFPSLYEGFGLPVLEAIASGVPVVCSNSSSLPEVAGGAAAMCEAMDGNRLCELIARGLEDSAWRAAAIQQGLENSKRFSWKRCAEETLKAYTDITESEVRRDSHFNNDLSKLSC
jgi:alpha-1,3-rhamnosyl/mannosyltransferase